MKDTAKAASEYILGEPLTEVAFEPLWDYVLADPIPVGKTAGGLHMPDGARVEDIRKMVIIKAGPGTYRDSGVWVPNPLRVGDVVFCLALTKPFTVVIKGHGYICLAGRDIVAIEPRADGSKPCCGPEGTYQFKTRNEWGVGYGRSKGTDPAADAIQAQSGVKLEVQFKDLP